MQTFLPYPDFSESSRVLDWRRLGKQRLEADQIRRVLMGEINGWRNHPAVLMWRGYEDALIVYRNTIITEWIARGYRNTMPLLPIPDSVLLPPWLGDTALHADYRAVLLHKAPEWYAQFGWVEEPVEKFTRWPTPTGR